MGRRRFPEISCALCRKPVDSLIDLSADENGKAVHEECYVKRLPEFFERSCCCDDCHSIFDCLWWT
jgi:hypothetical protein